MRSGVSTRRRALRASVVSFPGARCGTRNRGFAFANRGRFGAAARLMFGQREATMQRKRLPRAVFLALVVAALAAAAPAWLSGSAPAAGAAAQEGRSLPVFEVDPAWPTVPDGMKLGAASSIAIDADDNVWVLHRPLTLPPEDDAMAAPPGRRLRRGRQLHQGLGRSGRGLRVAPAGARPAHRSRGLRLAGGQQLPHQRPGPGRAGQRRPDAEVHAGRHARPADRPQQPEPAATPTR